MPACMGPKEIRNAAFLTNRMERKNLQWNATRTVAILAQVAAGGCLPPVRLGHRLTLAQDQIKLWCAPSRIKHSRRVNQASTSSVSVASRLDPSTREHGFRERLEHVLVGKLHQQLVCGPSTWRDLQCVCEKGVRAATGRSEVKGSYEGKGRQVERQRERNKHYPCQRRCAYLRRRRANRATKNTSIGFEEASGWPTHTTDPEIPSEREWKAEHR